MTDYQPFLPPNNNSERLLYQIWQELRELRMLFAGPAPAALVGDKATLAHIFLEEERKRGRLCLMCGEQRNLIDRVFPSPDGLTIRRVYCKECSGKIPLTVSEGGSLTTAHSLFNNLKCTCGLAVNPNGFSKLKQHIAEMNQAAA